MLVGSAGSRLAVWGDTDFAVATRTGLTGSMVEECWKNAGRMLEGVAIASLVAENVDLLCTGNKHWIWLWLNMLTLSTLTIWLCWEYACSGGSGFAERGESGFGGISGSELAGSMLEGVDVALLVAKNLNL